MLNQKIKRLNYKKLFLFGAYNAVMIISTIALIMDYFFKNYYDIVIDFIFLIATFIAYKLLFKKDDVQKAAVVLFWIASFIVALLLIAHGVDFDIVFTVLIPIILFISANQRVVIINLALYYLFFSFIFLFFYIKDPHNLFLHNSSYMLTLTICHMYIIAFGIFYFMAINESIRRLEVTTKAQATLLREVHHRVKNNLNLVSSILGLQSKKNIDDSCKVILKNNQNRLASMALLHEILYTQDDSIDHTSLKLYVHRLTKYLIDSSSLENIDLKCKIYNINLDINSLVQFGIMLNEMITNSIKHHKQSEHNLKIAIEFKRLENGYLLRYCDNNKNIDIKKLKEGFGYNLIKLAALYFKAEIKLQINDIFCYYIIFKKL